MEKELKRLNETPKIIKLDLTECQSLLEIHERIRKSFNFPEWYGKKIGMLFGIYFGVNVMPIKLKCLVNIH